MPYNGAEYSAHPEEIAVAPTIEELGLDQLSIEDRLAVAEAIWDSVSREVAAAPLSAPQRAELERRLADSIARPDAVTPWEVIKARALARARK
jgi:putative addiction module component (TIGR02574 family)